MGGLPLFTELPRACLLRNLIYKVMCRVSSSHCLRIPLRRLEVRTFSKLSQRP